MSVTGALFRLYRPIVGWFVVIFLIAYLIVVRAAAANTDLGFSMWLVLAGSAAKYWLLVVAMILVGMQLKQFVVNGVTRHEFLTAVAVFGLVASVAFALAVVVGHGLESVLLDAAGKRGAGYPAIGVGGMVREFAEVLPESIAYFVSGSMIVAGFYRWRPLTGLVVMVAGAVPAAVADGLLGVNEWGDFDTRLPYAAALAISLAATALVAWAYYRAISDVAIKRTAG
jgi:hypothetical protein